MLATHYGNVEDIEVLWTLIAILGLFFSIFNVKESIKDRKALKDLGIYNGRMRIVSTSIRSETTRAIKQMVFLVIGIFALYLPGMNASHLPFVYLIFGIIFRWGLILSSALTTYQSYLVWELRRYHWVENGSDSTPQ